MVAAAAMAGPISAGSDWRWSHSGRRDRCLMIALGGVVGLLFWRVVWRGNIGIGRSVRGIRCLWHVDAGR